MVTIKRGEVLLFDIEKIVIQDAGILVVYEDGSIKRYRRKW